MTNTAAIAAETALEPFKGSVEKGIFEIQFDAFSYAVAENDEPVLKQIEGSLVSRVLLKPLDKSNLEVFRSYEQELRAAGFTILLAATPTDNDPKNTIQKLYRAPFNDLVSRSYRNTDGAVYTNDLSRISTFGQYYLSASRTQGGTTVLVALSLSRERNLYLIDELTAAAMETGTVTVNLEAMRAAISETGKIAIYDVYFSTGSAQIEPASADALAVIAAYLTEAEGGFYVVGHTDDTGTLTNNLTLSEQRAAAIKKALVTDFGIAADRLETRGVGPLVPISNNLGQAGRSLNRRVEIVQRLAGD